MSNVIHEDVFLNRLTDYNLERNEKYIETRYARLFVHPGIFGREEQEIDDLCKNQNLTMFSDDQGRLELIPNEAIELWQQRNNEKF